MRSDNRAADQLRSPRIEYDTQPNAAGSVLIKMGGTHVLCGVSIENKVPPFLQDILPVLVIIPVQVASSRKVVC